MHWFRQSIYPSDVDETCYSGARGVTVVRDSIRSAALLLRELELLLQRWRKTSSVPGLQWFQGEVNACYAAELASSGIETQPGVQVRSIVSKI